MAQFQYKFDDPEEALAEAKKRIDEARWRRWRRLSLNGLGLPVLPPSFDDGELTYMLAEVDLFEQ
jgi:hypothetical protein